jgi:hypothetical protein
MPPKSLSTILHQHFGFRTFRPLQQEIIEASLAKSRKNDHPNEIERNFGKL